MVTPLLEDALRCAAGPSQRLPLRWGRWRRGGSGPFCTNGIQFRPILANRHCKVMDEATLEEPEARKVPHRRDPSPGGTFGT